MSSWAEIQGVLFEEYSFSRFAKINPLRLVQLFTQPKWTGFNNGVCQFTSRQLVRCSDRSLCRAVLRANRSAELVDAAWQRHILGLGRADNGRCAELAEVSDQEAKPANHGTGPTPMSKHEAELRRRVAAALNS